MTIGFFLGVALVCSFCPLSCGLELKDVCKKYDHCGNVSRFKFANENKPATARRIAAACKRALQQKCYSIEKENNGDAKRVPFFAANFSKGLQHDPVTGLLTNEGQTNYKRLVTALKTASQADFNAIMRVPGAQKFANPQGSFTFSLEGVDSAATKIPLFPHLSSPQAAAYLSEVYLMALTRDVLFNEYGTGLGTDANGFGGSLTNDAAAYLQALGSAYRGPRTPQGGVDAAVLFRSKIPGSLIGPFISQFFLLSMKSISYQTFSGSLGLANLDAVPFTLTQVQPIAKPHKDFVLSFADFVTLQNGVIPVPYSSNDYDASLKRYMVTGRDLSSYLHFDHPCIPYLNALNILLANKFPLSSANPYVNGNIINEGSFISLGFAEAESLIAGVALEILKSAWAHKWRAQRVLRPEAFAGLVHRAVITGTNPFAIDSLIFTPHAGIDLLDRVKTYNEQQGASTYLLSQAYPEGSPLHPSYPAGHAALGGACVTVLKAFFDNTVKIKAALAPVKPNPLDPSTLIPLVGEGEDQMTVASELDKLAVNAAAGRMFAGIHYRADSEAGLRLGEHIALKYLQDQALVHTEQGFEEFVLTKFDGTVVRVTAQSITPI